MSVGKSDQAIFTEKVKVKQNKSLLHYFDS